MKKHLKWYKRSENPRNFWLQLAVISVLIWLTAGLISFLKLPNSVMFVIKVIVGLAPCALFLFAILCWLEIKGRRAKLEKKFQRMEDINLILFGLLSVCAEITFQFSEGISYALPFTVASLLGTWMVRLSAPKTKEDEERAKKKKNILQSRFTNKKLMLMMFLGIIICIIFANYINTLTTALPNFNK